MASTLQKAHRPGFYKDVEIWQNDEYGRLRRQHLLHKKVMNSQLIHVSLPTDRPITILDSATCDGIWMLDAAEEYPNATFTGTDISQNHFEQLGHILPPSISFKIQNLLDDWPADDVAKYDLVHQRYCLALFDAENDAKIVKNLFSLVKPGGYIQFIEADMMSFEDGKRHEGMSRFMQFVEKAFPTANMNHRPGPGIIKWLEQAGAKNVKEEIHSFEVGAAANNEDLRMDTTQNMNSMISNFAMAASKWPGYWYTPEDFEVLADAVSHEMNTVGNTWRFWLVTAPK